MRLLATLKIYRERRPRTDITHSYSLCGAAGHTWMDERLQAGKCPPMRLRAREKVCRLVRLQKELGSVDVSSLSSSTRRVSALNAPYSSGMDPRSRFAWT
jgi:hypothetical protein